MGPIAPVIGIVGTLVSAVGAFAGAEAQAKQANYQAAIARNNAIVEHYKEINAINAGRQNAQQASLQNAARLAGIRGAIAASGVDPNSGSSELVQRSQREVGELGTENVYHNAAIQAYGYKVAASSDEAQANLYSAEAKSAPVAGLLGAAGSILGGAKSFYGGSSAGGAGVLSPDIPEDSSLADAGFGAG